LPFFPSPGFAINTIFYAAILWLLWLAPGRIRRFIRIRRGRCPSCGYVIAPGTCADGLCSECAKKSSQIPNFHARRYHSSAQAIMIRPR
jgi:hypothetical protein